MLIMLQTLLVVDFALCRNEQLLPNPKTVHELVVCVISTLNLAISD